MKKSLLPQANSLETVLKVFLYAGLKKDCNKENIAEYCNFEIRQADYYLGACIYLDLFDSKGKLTETGMDILSSKDNNYRQRVYELILNDELIGRIFSHLVLFPEDDIRLFAEHLARERYPDYGDAVIKRRSSCLVGWCNEIKEFIHL